VMVALLVVSQATESSWSDHVTSNIQQWSDYGL
jgi:hypothetical protein